MLQQLNIFYFIKIIDEPIVEISPDPISLDSGQDAVISCLTKGNPRPTSYTWTLDRPDKTPQTNLSTGDTYRLRNVDMTYDLSMIRGLNLALALALLV